MMYYSAKIYGAAPTVINATRRSLARLAQSQGGGRCLSTVMQLEYGTKDPMYAVFFGVFDSWIDILSSSTAPLRINRTWEKTYLKVTAMAQNMRWRCVPGCCYAIITVLLDLGWTLRGPTDCVINVANERSPSYVDSHPRR